MIGTILGVYRDNGKEHGNYSYLCGKRWMTQIGGVLLQGVAHGKDSIVGKCSNGSE